MNEVVKIRKQLKTDVWDYGPRIDDATDVLERAIAACGAPQEV